MTFAFWPMSRKIWTMRLWMLLIHNVNLIIPLLRNWMKLFTTEFCFLIHVQRVLVKPEFFCTSPTFFEPIEGHGINFAFWPIFGPCPKSCVPTQNLFGTAENRFWRVKRRDKRRKHKSQIQLELLKGEFKNLPSYAMIGRIIQQSL